MTVLPRLGGCFLLPSSTIAHTEKHREHPPPPVVYSAKLDYLRSYVSSAAQAVLAKGNSVPGLPGFQLGERRSEYDGHSIWQLHDGTKRVSAGAACVHAYTPLCLLPADALLPASPALNPNACGRVDVPVCV